MTNYELIKIAIKNKKQITCHYQGYYRELCPHVIGRKNGVEQALFYQFGGRSKTEGEISPKNGKWRCLRIGELSSVASKDGNWYTGNNHSRPQSCVDDIDEVVDYQII